MESQFWMGVVAAVVAFVVGRLLIRGLLGNDSPKVTENAFEQFEGRVNTEVGALKERIDKVEEQMQGKVDSGVFEAVVQRLEERLDLMDKRLTRIENKIDILVSGEMRREASSKE